MVLFWLCSGKITVFQPCSDITKSLSSYEWFGKGTIKVKPNQGNISHFCWPRKLPSVSKIHRQKKLFPTWFPSFSLPFCVLHISTETRDGMQTLQWEELLLNRQKNVCLISFTFRENYIPLEMTPLLCFYLRDVRRVIKRTYLSAATP